MCHLNSTFEHLNHIQCTFDERCEFVGKQTTYLGLFGKSSKLCYVNDFHQFRSNANLFEYATCLVPGMPWDFQNAI